jgi:hypothetical protein
MSTSLFNFNSSSDLSSWQVVNDGVMGGVSSSSININDDGNAVFSGTVRLENNGGFASLRHNFDAIKVSEKTELHIKLKGDGKAYQFRIKDEGNTYYSYVFSAETSGEWETIIIPLSEMRPQFRGRKLNIENFDKESISEFAILIGNKKKESFKLLIDHIELKN